MLLNMTSTFKFHSDRNITGLKKRQVAVYGYTDS